MSESAVETLGCLVIRRCTVVDVEERAQPLAGMESTSKVRVSESGSGLEQTPISKPARNVPRASELLFMLVLEVPAGVDKGLDHQVIEGEGALAAPEVLAPSVAEFLK